MKKYQNLSGNSGIIAYELGNDYIIIQFADGRYLYTNEITGKQHIDQMKHLAESGQGLATYINKFVRENFAQKLS